MILRRGSLDLVVWSLGFLLLFNVFFVASAEESPRVTDALGVVLGLWLLWRFATKGVRGALFAALLAISAIPFLWGIYAYSVGDPETAVISIRWMVAIPWAFALFEVARKPVLRASLIWGLWWGCIANLGVLLLQYYGFTQLTQTLGLAGQDAVLGAVYGADRAPGMHNHPNGSAAVVSLIVPLSLYLYYARKARAWVIPVGLGVLLLGTQFTSTRSALLVCLVTVLIFFVAYPNLRRSLGMIAPLVLIVLPILYWLGPPGGQERWQTDTETNMSERLRSNAGALEMSWQSPLGVGVAEGHEELQNRVGTEFTHNAFLQVGVMYGSLLAAWLTLLFLILSLQILTGFKTTWVLEAVLAFHVFGLFLWEEHLSSPTFIILTTWLAATGSVLLVDYVRASGPRAATVGRRPAQWPIPR